MAKKKTDSRAPNFPMRFDDGLREGAQAQADKHYRGNLTAYLNALVKADLSKNSNKPKK